MGRRLRRLALGGTSLLMGTVGGCDLFVSSDYGAPCCTAGDTADETHAYQGTVVEAGTTTPVAGIRVSLGQAAAATTGADGTWSLDTDASCGSLSGESLEAEDADGEDNGLYETAQVPVSDLGCQHDAVTIEVTPLVAGS